MSLEKLSADAVVTVAQGARVTLGVDGPTVGHIIDTETTDDGINILVQVNDPATIAQIMGTSPECSVGIYATLYLPKVSISERREP